MRGDNIYKMLREKGLSSPHFNHYAEFVRKQENPTENEILEAENNTRIQDERIRISEEKYRLEQEKKLNVNSSKARLAKLHNGD
jgi:hypothetical protein